MGRDNVICLIDDRDICEYYQLLKEVFNSQISYEKMKSLYKDSKKNKDIYLLGYYINDKIVGSVALNILTFLSGKCAIIWDVAVMEEYRRLGIATKLMNKAEEIAKGYEDVNKMWLFSGVQREAAHELYRKLGYDEKRDKAFVKVIR